MVSIAINYTLILQLINFLILMFVLNHFLYKPIRKILADRKSLFHDMDDRIKKAKTSLEAAEENKIHLNSENIKAATAVKIELKNEALVREKEVLEKAQKQAMDTLNSARQEMKLETEKAREALRSEADNLAKLLASKILGRAI